MNKITNSIKSSVTSLVCAFLGAFAGAEGTNKNWRRFLIPFALSGLAYGHLHNWWVLTIMAMVGAFSMGYGIPDENDEGSGLGSFWYNIVERLVYTISGFIVIKFPSVTEGQNTDCRGLQTFKEKIELLTNIFTRGTIAFMVNLSLISIPILKGNWLTYWIGCWFIKIVYVLFSWRDLGGIRVKDKYLLYPDIIVYGTIGLMASIMIYF